MEFVLFKATIFPEVRRKAVLISAKHQVWCLLGLERDGARLFFEQGCWVMVYCVLLIRVVKR